MPERIVAHVIDWSSIVTNALLFALVGMAIGIGQLLASTETLTARIIIGRAMSTGGIAMAAGAILVFFPDVPLIGQIGVAAALASLGTSGLERIIQRLMGK